MSTKRQSSINSQELQTDNKVFIALLIIAFILPWPHGGELVWQYLIFCISIFSLTAIYFVNNQATVFTALKSIKVPLILLGTWLLFQILQVVPLPLHFQNIVDQNLNPNNWQTISIAPNITLIEIIKHTSYITVFILALLLVNTKQRIINLANTLFFGSAIIALYSLVNHYTHGTFSLINSIPPWTAPWEKATHGTFSYQNHYASFLTLTIPLGYGLIYAEVKKSSNQSITNSKMAKIIDLFMSINGLYLLSLLVMCLALVKTASRGGNSIFVVSIAITFFCVLFQQKKSKQEKVKKVILWVISALIISVIIIASGVTDSLTKRLNSQGYTPNGRDLMHQTALTIIQERPLVGTGAGTYPVLQHKYKSPLLGTTAMSKRAHNDYLELLTNQGIIGFSLLAAATLLLYIRLLKGLNISRKNSNNKKTNSIYGLQVASFCSVTAILLHSLADFNFHLPANAVYFYLILALGLRIYFLNSETKQKI
jgi:O-antigen ligase